MSLCRKCRRIAYLFLWGLWEVPRGSAGSAIGVGALWIIETKPNSIGLMKLGFAGGCGALRGLNPIAVFVFTRWLGVCSL